MSAAQNQHYVPKFILRQFLSDQEKQQVAVFDKHSERMFITSISNIMAERRFNDFVIDDELFSIEDGFSRVESELRRIPSGLHRSSPADEREKRDCPSFSKRMPGGTYSELFSCDVGFHLAAYRLTYA